MTKHTPTNLTKAYSYVRFSTPEQAKGDSFRRQTEAAEKYAALHGLDMDTKFTFHDLGKSAFRGGNMADGMLGEFLSYVKSGDVEQGSYLLVENLDRVSRETPRKALRTLEDIVDAGVNVVTLSDNRTYTKETLNQDTMMLFASIMYFARANEESATKARRLREAWGNKRKNAAAKPLSALCPGWLRLRDDRTGFDEIPERAAVVSRVFDMTLAGKGQHTIAETLNREGVAPFGTKRRTPAERKAGLKPKPADMWHRTYIAKMLADPSVVGTFTPHRIEVTGGKRRRIPTDTVEGYFPAVIDREMFDRVDAMTNRRAVRGSSKAGMANILAGLAKCPKCGATMTRVNKGSGPKGGRPYLVCTVAKAKARRAAGTGCEYRQVRLNDVEEAIMEKAAVLYELLPSTDEALQGEWDRANTAEMAVSDEIENVVKAIERGGHSSALLDRLWQNEAAREDIRRNKADLERRIADTLTNRVQATISELVDAAEGEGSRDVAAINATLRQLFTKVEVDWSTGFLLFHWKHAPGEVSSIMYAWPKDDH
ncbi:MULTISPECIES: recombinase family protein [unclassified Mesorhizobium]|uniref:recombinase family protein n=1 Tax=unclassified Mesorhizobium TaxID=325217 RepID=UPI00333A31E5